MTDTATPPQGEARLDRRFELLEAIILAIATVFTAWAAFQATKWSGVQADDYSRAGAARTESTRAVDVATTQVTVDVADFQAWLAAITDENQRGVSSFDAAGRYTPNTDELSGFLSSRFSDDMRPAFDAWTATAPFVNADAPKTPFDMEEYELSALKVAEDLDRQADEFAASARDANQRGDNYVLVTVLLASVLFFAGISSKMDTFKARTLLISLAVVVLVGGIILLTTMPIEI